MSKTTKCLLLFLRRIDEATKTKTTIMKLLKKYYVVCKFKKVYRYRWRFEKRITSELNSRGEHIRRA